VSHEPEAIAMNALSMIGVIGIGRPHRGGRLVPALLLALPISGCGGTAPPVAAPSAAAPSAAVTSDRATLSYLAIGPGHLDPAFDPEVTAYAAEVDPAVTELVVWAEAADRGVAVAVDGMRATAPATVVELEAGETEVTIEAAPDPAGSQGPARPGRYTVRVSRRASGDTPDVKLDYVTGAMNQATVEHGGLTRRFLYYIPNGYDPDVPHPVIVGLHGFNHDVENLANQTYGSMHPLADRDGTLLLFPESTGSLADETYSWNPLYAGDMPIYDGLSRVDDVGYITALIDLFIGELNGDPDRVYVTGTSMGGAMTYALAAHVPGKLAAIAPVIMQVGRLHAARFQDAPPIPVMIITGTTDPLVDPAGMPDNPAIPNVSQSANVEYWKRRNGVSGPGIHTSLPSPVLERFNGEAVDSHIERFAWAADGADRAEVVYIEVVNGGHWLPIATDAALDPSMDLGEFDGTYLGVWNNDWDGAAAIYDWFMEHVR
jgi:polyhydroxybutyrate depolymerase